MFQRSIPDSEVKSIPYRKKLFPPSSFYNEIHMKADEKKVLAEQSDHGGVEYIN